jgi:hypothetical protein
LSLVRGLQLADIGSHHRLIWTAVAFGNNPQAIYQHLRCGDVGRSSKSRKNHLVQNRFHYFAWRNPRKSSEKKAVYAQQNNIVKHNVLRKLVRCLNPDLKDREKRHEKADPAKMKMVLRIST